MSSSIPTASRGSDTSVVTPRGEFVNGLRLALPVLPGTGAWGLVAGIAMIKAGLTVPQAFGMTVLVYAGSAQLACLPLIAADAPVGVILLTAAIVNLRFVIYGLGLAPIFRNEPAWRRLLFGYLNADLGYVLFAPRQREEPGRLHARWLFIGIVSGNWVVWQVTSAIGIILGARIPPDWGLELAGSLALLILAVPLVTGLPTVIGVVVAGAVGLWGASWPMRLGIIAGAVAGIAAAMLAERLDARHGKAR